MSLQEQRVVSFGEITLDVGLVVAGLGLLLTVGVMAFAAAAETSLTVLSGASARRLIDAGVPRAKALQTLLEDPSRFVTTLVILKAGAYVGSTGLVTWLTLKFGLSWMVGIPLALLLLTFILLCVQMIGRAIAVRSTDRVALHLGPWVRGAATLLSPVVKLLWSLSNVLAGQAARVRADELFLSDDGLRFLINVSEERGLIEETEKEMIASIFELGETVAREVMVPRIDIVAIDQTHSIQEALDMIVAAGHSRIPVYRDTIDNIQGVLYAKDLLRPYREGRYDVPIDELMRPAYFVPESKKVDELLRELQQRKVHMAIIVDEYGGTAGVVTIEDLLEEIVGDIQDEYDSEAPLVVHSSEDEYVFDARIDLDEVSRLVGVDLPTDESDTLGGFIFSQLGRVPAVGSQVHFDPLILEVQSISGRRIQQVRVIRQHDAGIAQEELQGHSRKPLSAFTSMF